MLYMQMNIFKMLKSIMLINVSIVAISNMANTEVIKAAESNSEMAAFMLTDTGQLLKSTADDMGRFMKKAEEIASNTLASYKDIVTNSRDDQDSYNTARRELKQLKEITSSILKASDNDLLLNQLNEIKRITIQISNDFVMKKGQIAIKAKDEAERRAMETERMSKSTASPVVSSRPTPSLSRVENQETQITIELRNQLQQLQQRLQETESQSKRKISELSDQYRQKYEQSMAENAKIRDSFNLQSEQQRKELQTEIQRLKGELAVTMEGKTSSTLLLEETKNAYAVEQAKALAEVKEGHGLALEAAEAKSKVEIQAAEAKSKAEMQELHLKSEQQEQKLQAEMLELKKELATTQKAMEGKNKDFELTNLRLSESEKQKQRLQAEMQRVQLESELQKVEIQRLQEELAVTKKHEVLLTPPVTVSAPAIAVTAEKETKAADGSLAPILPLRHTEVEDAPVALLPKTSHQTQSTEISELKNWVSVALNQLQQRQSSLPTDTSDQSTDKKLLLSLQTISERVEKLETNSNLVTLINNLLDHQVTFQQANVRTLLKRIKAAAQEITEDGQNIVQALALTADRVTTSSYDKNTKEAVLVSALAYAAAAIEVKDMAMANELLVVCNKVNTVAKVSRGPFTSESLTKLKEKLEQAQKTATVQSVVQSLESE